MTEALQTSRPVEGPLEPSVGRLPVAAHRFDNAKRRRPDHHARQAMLTPPYALEPVRELLVGIQDMGAAGLTSSAFEMASRAGSGVSLDLDQVPARPGRGFAAAARRACSAASRGPVKSSTTLTSRACSRAFARSTRAVSRS